MTKRNTEGYVLAYLLIVIAVMGAIAATLMTSTVQVMASQQNSIQYMKDKYAAMGEVEKLVLTLEHQAENIIPVVTDFDYSSDAEAQAKATLISFLKEFLPDASKDTSWIQWNLNQDSYTFHEKDPYTPDDTYNFTVKKVSDSACVISIYELLFDDEHYDIIIEPYEKDNPNYDQELESWNNGEIDTEPSKKIKKYKYDITDVNFKLISYDILSSGGGT